MTFDISNFDLTAIDNEGAELEIVIPRGPKKGEPTGLKIRVAGMRSNKFRKARNASFRAASKLKEDAPDHMEQVIMIKNKMLASMVLGWSGLIENGKEVEYTEKEALRVFNQYDWIVDQVDEFLGKEENFTKG